MWGEFEARLEENERERSVPLRRTLFNVIRKSTLRPGDGVTKKMLAFEFGETDRLLWEIDFPARNVFLHVNWHDLLAASGFACDTRPYQQGMKDGGRHSALSRNWSFGESDCLAVRIEDADQLRQLLGILLQPNAALALDPAAVGYWIERLRHFFPSLDRFDRPDPDFDERERGYKLQIAHDLKAAIDQAATDEDYAHAIHTALAESNLLQWRVYWAMSPKGNADRDRLWPALRALATAALGSPDGFPEALESFVTAWVEAVPQGKPDPARQVAEFLFLHLAPNDGIYIRHSVRQAFWKRALGRRFPDHASMAETYRDELRFMQAVRHAFEARGLAPRDMIDVQGAMWVAYNYKDEDSVSFDREAIETAMDAYDHYRQSGEHGAIFSAFGDPRDYWVRSTRERPDRVYPTKPIVGFMRSKTELNGGWGQKHDAAALLHNAGYIIVDSADTPVAPPERYEHLIRNADRIRLCAFNYYVSPARDKGASKVSIRSGDLSQEMGLDNVFPAICSALGGEKFQQCADVPPPTHTIPNPSSSTVFTYQLTAQEGQKSMISQPMTGQATTNLILYGPPGTGKTYQTALEAVRLCLGDAAAEALRDDRRRLMEEYHRLCGEGRIEFVTFHQSFSYEDFVEGLRPTTRTAPEGDQDHDANASGGFSLEPHAGVFKRISERARLDTGDAPTQRLDRSRSIYKIALGQRGDQEDRIREGLDGYLIHLGWGGDIDWSDERFDDFEEIRKEWNEKKDPDASGKDPNIEMTYAFRSGLQTGDYVVISDGRDTYRAFGQVTGEYRFDPDASFHPHRRSVEWIWRDDAGAKREAFYTRNFRRQSAYRLDQGEIDWDGLETVVIGTHAERPVASARPHVLIIDEINRANISRVFGELITLLEVDKRLGCDNEITVSLPYSNDGKRFGVPANLHIIGTMNTADRSIALLDTALRRRFSFRELMPDTDALRSALAANHLDAENLDGINLCKMMDTINERIEYLFDREHQIGHAYFTSCCNREDVEKVMRHKVIPLLTEYFYEDWSKVAAVLGDSGSVTGSRFIEAAKLSPPAGFLENEYGDDKLRWTVKDTFDFSEFEI